MTAQVRSSSQTPTSRLTDSLWEKAVDALDDKDKLGVDFERADKLAILEDVLRAVDEKKQACLKGRWKYKKDNKEIIIRDQLEKVMVWVNKFKQVGDNAVQYDPAHAALPWAGVRFFLQVTVNDIQTFGAMVDGIELVSNLITRYAILEKLYLRTSIGTRSVAQNQFEKAILELYTAVLKYLSKSRHYYDLKTYKRVILSVVQTAESSVDVYICKILDKQASVDACARVIDAEFNEKTSDKTQDILSKAKDVQEKVYDVEREVQDVQRGVQKVQLSIDASAMNNQHLNEEAQRLKTILSQLEEPIVRSAIQLSDLHDSLERTERKELIKWMSAIPCGEHHQTIGKDFMPESGQWLLKNPKFIEWRKSSAKSMLWLHGIPGSGKSKLVYCVVECINKHNSSNVASAPMAYFYCARNSAEPERANPDEIMRSILKQLSCATLQRPVREPVAGTYKRKKEDADNEGCEPAKLTLQECTELILALLETIPATIIIDALDECDPSRRHELLLALDKIREESASLVKVFVSSRDDQDIVCRLIHSPDVFIHATDNGEDIENFVRFQVNQSIENKTLLSGNVTEELKSRIISSLIEGAQGMFRWVSLQIQNLCDSQRMKHEKDINAELGRLPKTLRESYDIIYQQIENAGLISRQVAENAMKWLLCAQRPLKPPEFIAALSIDFEGQYIPLDSSQLLHMCCNMVVLDEKLETFRFAHLSVREYLESRDIYTKIESHTCIAERCVDTYILESSQESFRKQNHELIQYATLYWPIHCQRIGIHQWGDRLMTKVRQFLFKDYAVAPSFMKWSLAASDSFNSLAWDNRLRADLEESLALPQTPLFLACRFGWLSIICDICTLGNIDWNERNNKGKTGMILAAASGHEAVVELLLEKGSDLESRDTKYRMPLSWAAKNGHEAVVELLLEKGADLESRDTKYSRTPLLWAAKYGHKAVVELLLEKGADLESRDTECGRTPLSWAAENGHEAVVELLLEKGAQESQ